MDDTAKAAQGMGLYSSLVDPVDDNLQPIQPVKQKQETSAEKGRVSFYLKNATRDNLKDFIVFQRTKNNKPYYHMNEAIEEALQLLFVQVGFHGSDSID